MPDEQAKQGRVLQHRRRKDRVFREFHAPELAEPWRLAHSCFHALNHTFFSCHRSLAVNFIFSVLLTGYRRLDPISRLVDHHIHEFHLRP